MKKTLKVAVKIKGSDTPVYLEGEEQGVIVTEVIEVDVTPSELSSAMFAKWMFDKEREILESAVEVKWYEEAGV